MENSTENSLVSRTAGATNGSDASPVEGIPRQTDKEVFIAIFLIGMLCLMVELIQVRMLSFFLGSISNFLAIPIALFGLALGSLFCHFIYKGDKDRLIRVASILVFPVLVITFFSFFFIADAFFNQIHVVRSNPGRDAARLLVYSAMFLPTYFTFGILLTTYFTVASHMIGRLYFFDLVGAGLGCLITSLMFTYADLPPVISTLLLCSLLLLFNTQFKYKSVAAASAVAIFGIVQALVFTGVAFKEHPDPQTLASTLFGRSARTGVEELASRWNHLTRTGLYRNQANTMNSEAASFVVVQDDGISNVGVIKYDPALTAEEVKKTRTHHALPQLLGRNPKTELVMFAGTGKDMIYLDAMSGGKASITGVEINESVKEMALHPAAFSMNLKHFFKKPNINYVIREGRDFLNNDTHTYDLILAATNGAVFANRTGHTRKYLDTYEAMQSYLDHLNKDGMIIFVNQPIDRKVESLRKLFEERKIADFSKCVYAFGRHGSRTLQSAVIQLRPFTEQEIDIIQKQHQTVNPEWEVVYNPYGSGLEYFEDYVKVPVEKRNESLVIDDKPFTKKVELAGFQLFPGQDKLTDLEYASNWIKIFTCIMFAGVSLILIFIARFLGKKEGRLPLLWLMYFFFSGVSYMGVEIGLIGKTELFVGNPLYAVAVILAFFLIFNGLGAYLQDRFQIMKGIKSLILITAVSVVWGVLCVEVYNRTMLSIPMFLKVLCVALAVMPSGTALGMYYPFGVATLVKAGRESVVPITYGAATLSSVLGSSLAMTLICNVGFSTIIIAGAIGYTCTAFVYLAAKRFAL
jgi:hypothetical protein